jgi:hypothetical protein
VSADREHLARLVEAGEALLAGDGTDLVDRLRVEVDAGRAHLFSTRSDAEIASRAAYAAGRAAGAGAVP